MFAEGKQRHCSWLLIQGADKRLWCRIGCNEEPFDRLMGIRNVDVALPGLARLLPVARL